MQHIDRKALYTDLEARVAYLHSFLDFGQSTSTPPPAAQIWPHISRRTNHSPVLTHLSSTGDIDALISGRKVRPPPLSLT